MIEKKSKSAIVSERNGVTLVNMCGDERPNFRPMCEEIFENVSISIDDNGIMTLTGDFIAYAISEHVSDKIIEDGQGVIHKTFWGRETIEYPTWVRLKGSKRKTITTKNFTIVE